jgi:FkbH-like protein
MQNNQSLYKNNLSISDYMIAYKNFRGTNNDLNPFKIAILASFTTNGFKEVLSVKCLELGISPEIYVGGYNQYSQEILNNESDFYKFNPNLSILFIDSRSIFGEDYFISPYSISDLERSKLVEVKLLEILKLIDNIKKHSSSHILIHNFEIPIHSPLGILENRRSFGFTESFKSLNRKIVEKFKNDPKVFVFDYDSFCSKLGKNRVLDEKMYYLADIKLNLEHIPSLCDEYFAYIKPLNSIMRKCIVLDLDNTLWGGIIGEDGLNGIKLGPTPEGKSYWEFQKFLLALFNRGIILAINSRNNLDDALKVLHEHPYMVLKEDNFAAMEINWNDKITNMRSIADELNIGMDTFVFIDDDSVNRELIRQALPEVLVVELPTDPSLYLKTIFKLNEFNNLQITEEDITKGKMYVEERKRKSFEKSYKKEDLTEYLNDLDIKVTIEEINDFNLPRISQLTQKTNQFNLTTKRYLEEDIKRFKEDSKYFVYCIDVQDRFGDYGITGMTIIKDCGHKWVIDSFLLSCRVIGRQIEKALLSHVLKIAKKRGAKFIIGKLIYTAKNIPSRDFYSDNGFKLVEKSETSEIWKYNLKDEYKIPEFIQIRT